MDFSRFTTISFDCYGTLIDWESGILPVVQSMFANHDRSLPDAAILALYGEFEAKAETGPYRTYREVLQSVMLAFAERLDFTASPSEIRSLDESLAAWRPFPDTVAALRGLQQRYNLAIISNIDDDLFAETRKHLEVEVEFTAVVTAQQARSYKPSLNNFNLALRALAISPDRILHAGQSIYHDVVPARSLGISTVWVNRKSARPGIGAVRTSPAPVQEQRPDLEVPDLATLVATATHPNK